MHLLRSKRFLPLFITQFFGAFNDNAFKNAFLIWFTYDVAQKSGLNAAMMVTLAAGLFVLPFFLFSATTGQVVDKYEKSWLTQKIKQVEIILMTVSAVCFYLQSVYGLLIVLFLLGVQSSFFGPIKYSLLPEHLEENELISGNGLIEGGTFLSILLGTIFGGLIIRMEYGRELLSFAIIGFAMIGWLSSRYIPVAPIGDAQLKIGWNIIRETWKIIGYARKERTVWFAIIGISWFWLIGAMFLTQFPTYTKEVIGGNEHVVTLFLTVFSIGIGVGSIWCNYLLKGEINSQLVPYGSIGMSIAIMLFSVSSILYSQEYSVYTALKTTPEFVIQSSGSLSASVEMMGLLDFFSFTLYSWVIVVSLLVLSICAGIYIIPLYTIMQHHSDNKYLARIIAANNVLNTLFMVFASVVALTLIWLNFTIIQVLFIVGVANIPAFLIVRRVVWGEI